MRIGEITKWRYFLTFCTLFAAFASAALSACSRGGGDAPPPTASTPVISTQPASQGLNLPAAAAPPTSNRQTYTTPVATRDGSPLPHGYPSG